MSEPSVNQVLLEGVGQLEPAIASRRLTLDFDLDHVPLRGNRLAVATAVQGMLRFVVDRAPDGDQLSITLIASGDYWELEVAGDFQPPMELAKRSPGTRLAACRGSIADRTESLQQAETAALMCGGDIEFWCCPQGGMALVLRMPQGNLVESWQRAA